MKTCSWCGTDLSSVIRHPSLLKRARFCDASCYYSAKKSSRVEMTSSGPVVVTARGQRSPISEEDVELASSLSWHVDSVGYLSSGGSRRFHSLLFQLSGTGLVVDHIDRNKLNNRRENLRMASPTLNVRNSKIPKTNTSGIKGVSWDSHCGKWFAYLGVSNRRVGLGRHHRIEDAETARRNAEEVLWNKQHPELV